MQYESMQPNGPKAFIPDASRGYWSDPRDFIYISLGLAFKLDSFFEIMSWFLKIRTLNIVFYLVCAVIYIVPLMILQSFMGQFSSSGFISAFRMMPLYKGLGFVSLAINYLVLLYSVLLMSIPLLYFFYSFYPILPWSCDSDEYYLSPAANISKDKAYVICDSSHLTPKAMEEGRITQGHLPIVMRVTSERFFKSHFTNFHYYGEMSFSWEMFYVNMLTWIIIGGIFFKFSNTGRLGILLRYMIWGTLVVAVIFLIRLMCLPGAIDGLSSFTPTDIREHFSSIPLVLGISMCALGPGWGSILTLASFNKFNTNIVRYSWIICFAQMFIFYAFTLMTRLVDSHLRYVSSTGLVSRIENRWILYWSTGSAIANMEVPNLWSFLFFGMLFTAGLVFIITELQIVFVSICDESLTWRQNRSSLMYGIIGSLAIFSIYLCTNHGILYFTTLSADVFFTQTILHLLFIYVVLWVYGRERFQRDFLFMLGQPFQTWKVNILRFVAPIFLIVALIFALMHLVLHHMRSTYIMDIMTLHFGFLPWILVPGYAIWYIKQMTGDFHNRYSRSCKPADWHPVDSNDRQRYEESLGNVILHEI